MLLLPGASQVQRFDSKYPGVAQRPTRGVLHTTEGGSWPSYEGGGTAPNLTAYWNGKALEVRQHFPLDMSSRALKNLAGGVLTNTHGVIQIELVGTCSKGGPGLFWPEAPRAALDALAQLMRAIEAVTAIPRKATTRPWINYPASYGNSPARMSFSEWEAFSGWCGHQHVPENDHGDPGALDITYLIGATPAPSHPEEDELSAADSARLERIENFLNWAFHPRADDGKGGVDFARPAFVTSGELAKTVLGLPTDAHALRDAVKEALAKGGDPDAIADRVGEVLANRLTTPTA